MIEMILVALALGALIYSVLSQRITSLEQKVTQLQDLLEEASSDQASSTEVRHRSSPAPVAQAIRGFVPAPTVVPTAAPQPPTPEPVIPPRNYGQSARERATPSQPPPEAPTPKQRSWTDGTLEAFVGGKLLNRVGAVALVLGVLFFLKYAFDNEWVTPWMRVAIGLVAGGALLIGAERTARTSLRIFSQGLVAAAIPILYLSVYASWEFYHLVPYIPAFLGMVGITILMLWLALRHDSLFIGCLAVAAGMLTPYWMSTGSVNTAGLFSYLLLLELGIAGIVLGRGRWRILMSIAGTCTWAWWALWLLEISSDQLTADRPVALLLTSLIGILAIAFDFLATRQRIYLQPQLDRALSLASAITFVSCILLLVEPIDVQHIIQYMLVGFVLAFAAMAWLSRKAGEHMAAVHLQYVLLAVGSALIFCIRLDHPYGLCGIISLAVATALTARWLRLRTLTIAAILFWGVCWIAVLIQTTLLNMWHMPFFNEVGTTVLFVCGATWILGRILTEARNKHLAPFGIAMHAITLALVMLFLYKNTSIYTLRLDAGAYIGRVHDHYHWISAQAGTLIVVVTSTTILWLSRRNWIAFPATSVAAIVAASLVWMATSVEHYPEAPFTPFLNFRMFAGIAIIACLVASVRKQLPHYPDALRMAMHRALYATTLLVASYLCSAEAVWSTYLQIHEYMRQGLDTQDLWNRFHIILSGTWIGFSAVMLAAGFIRKQAAVRIVAIAILAISIVKVFLFDLSFLVQPYRIVSFMVLGVILLAASFLYGRFKHIIVGVSSQAAEGQE